MESIVRGDLVWGKWKRNLWWPAIALNAEDCGRDDISNNKMWLFWFGDHKINEIDCKNIVKFKENFSSKYNAKGGKKYLEAVGEILFVLATRCNMKLESCSLLLQWAADGFEKSKNYEDQTYDLPKIVLKFLNQNAFKRKLNDSDSETDTDDLISSIANGSKNLNDICISCCNSSAKAVIQHPFFLGGVCFTCKKNVDRIYKLAPGRIRDMCILCGQGGTLLICNNEMCLRSFCQLCIEYLTPEGSLQKILNDTNWFCYACKEDHSENCFIRVRKTFVPSKPNVIPVPKKKNPIGIIADSSRVIKVLKKKKLAVRKYCTFDPDEHVINFNNLQVEYKDLSWREFTELSADLVCGGYFHPYTLLDDRKESVISFFVNFYAYVFCLDNAKLYKASVFFIYISVAEIFDDLMLSRVLRFLKVEPISVKCENHLFSVWTNISSPSFTCDRTLLLKKYHKETAEECVLSHFLEPLKRYFKKVP